MSSRPDDVTDSRLATTSPPTPGGRTVLQLAPSSVVKKKLNPSAAHTSPGASTPISVA